VVFIVAIPSYIETKFIVIT